MDRQSWLYMVAEIAITVICLPIDQTYVAIVYTTFMKVLIVANLVSCDEYPLSWAMLFP